MFRQENKVANWYANKGKGIFIKIAIVLSYIGLILLPISCLVVAIILLSYGFDFGGFFFIGIPFFFFIMFFTVCFLKGELVLLKRVNGERHYELEVKEAKHREKSIRKPIIRKKIIEIKDEHEEKHQLVVEEEIRINDKVVLKFDSRVSPLDDTVIPAKTIGTVCDYSGNRLLVEFDVGGRLRIISLKEEEVSKYSE